jgi:hypothetical protein
LQELKTIILYFLPQPTFEDIFENPASDILPLAAIEKGFAGTLIVDKKSKLGDPGAFKTCHQGILSMDKLPQTGLGSTERQGVAVKRIYVRRTIDTPDVLRLSKDGLEEVGVKAKAKPKTVLLRMSLGSEADMIATEANCICFAAALLGMCYTFVDKFLASLDPGARPAILDIPRFRFVDAAIAVTQAMDISSKEEQMILLIEEVISREEGWVKDG